MPRLAAPVVATVCLWLQAAIPSQVWAEQQQSQQGNQPPSFAFKSESPGARVLSNLLANLTVDVVKVQPAVRYDSPDNTNKEAAEPGATAGESGKGQAVPQAAVKSESVPLPNPAPIPAPIHVKVEQVIIPPGGAHANNKPGATGTIEEKSSPANDKVGAGSQEKSSPASDKVDAGAQEKSTPPATGLVHPVEPALKIVRASSPLKPGDRVTVRIQTTPGAHCMISCPSLSEADQAVLKIKKANRNGLVTWTWRLSKSFPHQALPISVNSTFEGHEETAATTIPVLSVASSNKQKGM